MSDCECPHHPFGCYGHPYRCRCAKDQEEMPEVIGTLDSVEWPNEETMDEDEEREPGTYVTIKVPDDSRWGFGKVAIRYVEGE